MGCFIIKKSSNLLFEYSITGGLDRCDTPCYWALTKQVEDLPHLNAPIIRDFDDIPRTATMKVRRLYIEELLKNEG